MLLVKKNHIANKKTCLDFRVALLSWAAGVKKDELKEVRVAVWLPFNTKQKIQSLNIFAIVNLSAERARGQFLNYRRFEGWPNYLRACLTHFSSGSSTEVVHAL